jgi:hypothetical protein
MPFPACNPVVCIGGLLIQGAVSLLEHGDLQASCFGICRSFAGPLQSDFQRRTFCFSSSFSASSWLTALRKAKRLSMCPSCSDVGLFLYSPASRAMPSPHESLQRRCCTLQLSQGRLSHALNDLLRGALAEHRQKPQSTQEQSCENTQAQISL